MTSPRASDPNGSAPEGATRDEALRRLRAKLAGAGFETAALEARVLLLAALAISAAELIARPFERLTAEQASRLAAWTARRLSHEPVARILGEREFWGLPFILSPETLVPRADTETVVETAIDLVARRQTGLRIADLGTGSGCLLVALLHELPHATGIGVDRSAGAARTARLNATRNGVWSRSLFVVSDWGAALAQGVDLIVSNPPYIATGVVDRLEPEVREHDPRLALDGGEDGLEAYRIILPEARRLLSPEGHLVLEIGYDQEPALRDLAATAGFTVVRFAKDLAGNPRCVALKPT
ncbi:peptide chain release factor N(5)-glutamine methyltransferase [Microvirga brassicacearum]|uniref:Release factor glutamine methyltransferase n=1 Tax=Microvirga brassicacearum TaxID=2580413 RepID=A0A5N3P635_9HYPH|nr:peptide chain release factor N(5)-glutamine methyltransferase [Microvirga brassicacearum]KAB0265217.1 peptide chain release factor N(5)-glutamine methyltransferase [Microvirga brassicacearum]